MPDAGSYVLEAAIADFTIASAVARGSQPELEIKSNFRKKSNDLFKAQRPVEIGDRDMVLRLRIRAKLKRAISVELRF